MRESRSQVLEVRAGCFNCAGVDAKWTGKNAMMLAARHHDVTGHSTWADQTISVCYGPPRHPDPDQPGLFEAVALA